MTKDVLILFCGCSYSGVIPNQTKTKVLGAIEQSDVRFRIVSDICRAAAQERDFLKKAAGENTLKVVGCHERAMKWLFEWAGIDTKGIQFYNMRVNDPDEVITALLGESVQSRAEAIISNSTDWIPWFPVIDYDLCANCKQCMNFCLFSVYTLVDGKVTVTNPKGCKTNCPACAKVCPKSAVIFPKYDKVPFNGAVVDENSVQSVDISSLADVDIRARLRDRSSRKRFAPSDESDVDSRVSQLKDLQNQLDVPQDVIDSLGPKSCKSPFCNNKCSDDSAANHE